MTMNLLRVSMAATVALALVATIASAQERKKQNDRQRSQENSSGSSTYSGGMPSCNGGMFIIQDGSTAQCRHPDGRTCTVRAGTSGYATVSDCK